MSHFLTNQNIYTVRILLWLMLDGVSSSLVWVFGLVGGSLKDSFFSSKLLSVHEICYDVYFELSIASLYYLLIELLYYDILLVHIDDHIEIWFFIGILDEQTTNWWLHVLVF